MTRDEVIEQVSQEILNSGMPHHQSIIYSIVSETVNRLLVGYELGDGLVVVRKTETDKKVEELLEPFLPEEFRK